jgi:hypothetical protein
MLGTLNVGKQNNLLHNLDVHCEMNLLSLVSPWYDNIYYIQTKSATVLFNLTFRKLFRI